MSSTNPPFATAIDAPHGAAGYGEVRPTSVVPGSFAYGEKCNCCRSRRAICTHTFAKSGRSGDAPHPFEFSQNTQCSLGPRLAKWQGAGEKRASEPVVGVDSGAVATLRGDR